MPLSFIGTVATIRSPSGSVETVKLPSPLPVTEIVCSVPSKRKYLNPAVAPVGNVLVAVVLTVLAGLRKIRMQRKALFRVAAVHTPRLMSLRPEIAGNTRLVGSLAE